MKVYKHESDRGLSEEVIKATATTASVAVMDERRVQATKLFRGETAQYLKTEIPNDVMCVHSILVSTNWNLNDEVFTSDEVWAARRTPIGQPANRNHFDPKDPDKYDIVGTIVDCWPVDDKYEYIYADQDNLPDFFHLLCRSYLWEYYYPNEIGTIKSGIDDNKMFVSMECRIKDFGYAIRRADSQNVELLPRTEITSWLTASLRRFGGTGKVNINGTEYLVGRWLRGITFTGMGFVEQPANPESINFQDYISHASRQSWKKLSDSDANKFSVDKEQSSAGLSGTRVLASSNKVLIWQI